MTGAGIKQFATVSAGIQVRRFQARGWSADKAMIDRSPLNLVSRSLFNPTMGYATYIVPGVLILILQQTMLIGIGMISGTRREQIMGGKNVPRRPGRPHGKDYVADNGLPVPLSCPRTFHLRGRLPNLGFSNADKHCNDFSLSPAFFAVGHSVRTGSGRIF